MIKINSHCQSGFIHHNHIKAQKNVVNLIAQHLTVTNRRHLTHHVDNPLAEKLKTYTQMSSEAYHVWFPERNKCYEDANFFKHFIKDGGQPALEIGCGDGRLLIPYVHEGLDVEGLDISPMMIEKCRKKAMKHGKSIKLYEQAMQHLNIPRRYGTIFIPCGSFMLVDQLEEAKQTLQLCYKHLNPLGRLIIPLFIPTVYTVEVSKEWRLRRENKASDDAIIKCWENASFDQKNQIERSEYFFQIFKDCKLIETEKEKTTLRWYTQNQFHTMLNNAGFKDITCVDGYTDQPAEPASEFFTFIAKRSN